MSMLRRAITFLARTEIVPSLALIVVGLAAWLLLTFRRGMRQTSASMIELPSGAREHG